jgi:hypothetical protein
MGETGRETGSRKENERGRQEKRNKLEEKQEE